GVDQCLIWEVFANRGVGTGASQGFAFSITDQVESFTMPDENDPSLANCTSLGMGEFNIDEIKIYPNPTNGMLKIKTNRNMGEVTISLTDINGRQILSNHLELFNETELDLTQLQTGIYILNIQGANFDFNKKIIKN
ncbi:MAG TPA: T9SS type A sorting domain-containing protein, partial [Aquaticitalea sp.]|nr:T9SS type A sorting domain-containing protein [Aquaticitalea sp.]